MIQLLAFVGGFVGELEHKKSEPQSLILKGLYRLTRRTLEGNESLRFRVSLARNALQVDTNPNALSVSQFATHLIAEIDQLSLAEKRSGGGGKKEEGKVKKLEVPRPRRQKEVRQRLRRWK